MSMQRCSIGTLAIVVACAGSMFPRMASAQTRFSTAAASAREVAADRLADEVGVVLADCTSAANLSAKRGCISARRRAGRDVLRATYLVELPAASLVRIGPYEPSNGGFRIFVGGFRVPTRAAGGALATAPTTMGLMPAAQVVGTGFALVPWISAPAWLQVHRPEELTLRVLVRLGDDFEDPGAPEPNARYGVRLVVAGIQIFSNATGDTVMDTFADRVPPAPQPLVDRVRLWSHDVRAETLFTASDGTIADLNVRIEPRDPGSTSMTALLMQTVNATSIELFRVTTPCCSASIDVRRHGSEKVLVIVTEQSSEVSGTGRGRVVLLQWNSDARLFEERADWVGTNGAPPPAWVLDSQIDP